MRGTITRGTKHALDRPGLRWLLSSSATMWARVAGTEVRSVRFRDGCWIHHLADGVVVDRVIATRRSLDGFDAKTRDTWEFVYSPSPGDTVVDIGAGIGSEVYRFSRAVGPGGRVIAVEANPKTCDCLRMFCQLNELANVEVLNVAVSDADGTVMIEDGERHISNSIVRDSSQTPVPAVRLDTLLDRANLTRVDYMKINIEGAEVMALKGLGAVASRVDALAISCHDFKADLGHGEFFRTRDRVRELVAEAGYSIVPREDDRPWVRDQVNALRETPRPAD